jgi:hypothetical protein
VDGAYYQNITGKATLDMGFNHICANKISPPFQSKMLTPQNDPQGEICLTAAYDRHRWDSGGAFQHLCHNMPANGYVTLCLFQTIPAAQHL